jgi:asparagine synthase (glutamine-hydrolysing)
VEGAFPKGALPKHLKDKFEKLLLCLRSKDHESLYLALLSQVQDPTSYLVNKPSSLSNSAFKLRGASSALLREDTLFSMQYLDSIFYLPEDILTKVDRATMAVGLESRAPFLDKRTLDFAWRLPPSLRVQNRTGKWILRSLLDRYVPRSMVDRPKSGFAIPINHWLKGSMRSWAESLINSDAIRSVGVFEPSAVARLWENYLKGNENSQYQVWNILMFQAWHMSSRQSLVAVRTMAPAAAPFVEGGSLEIG